MSEHFGAVYERPAQRDCPDCGCCTAALCERGRINVRGCAEATARELVATVRACPCSAATTVLTAAWRMEQVGATLRARERPLAVDVEAFLRALADGEDGAGGDFVGVPWETYGFTSFVDGVPVITDLGRTYLAARTDARIVTPVRVVDVDRRTRTVRVEVPAWRAGAWVTVLLDQVLADLDVATAQQLPLSRWLAAEANCEAPDAERLVLTRFRAPADDGTAVTRVQVPTPEQLVPTMVADVPSPPPFALIDQSGAGL